MPFASKAQARFMYAAAQDKKMAKKLGVPQSVAKKVGIPQSVGKKFVKEGQSSLKRLPEKKKGKM